MHIVNQGRIRFEYKVSERSPVIKETIFSNEVLTEIVRNTLEIEKNVDKQVANIGEILTYSITIKNISEQPITNLFFEDHLNKETLFIKNSLKVNDKRKRCTSPQKGFMIEYLKSGEQLKITFKVTILSQAILKIISNKGCITYDYIYNTQKEPIRITLTSNEVQTKVQNKLFKQINVTEFIDKESELFNQCVNNVYEVQFSLIKSELISPCTVLVVGTLTYNIDHKHSNKYFDHEKTVSSITKGFSTTIKVPLGMRYWDKITSTIQIENSAMTLMAGNNLMISTQLLIYIT